ncbi:MAG TPA: hypothetical protein VHL80_11150 [Polyangia bacterium]|nr:hypothetical protein [Polyangia bacterium]
MRTQDIRRTIARTRATFLLALALAFGAACRGGCSRPSDPAATVQGRLAMLPEPVRVVVSLDAAKLRASAAVTKLGALAKDDPEGNREIEELRRRAGFDPLTQLDSVLVGFPQNARERGELALVLRAQHLDQARLVAYVRDELQEKGDDLVSTPHGRFTLWAARSKPDVAGFFVDERTFVLGAGGWAPRLAELAATAHPGDSAATDIDLTRLTERVADHAIWAAAIIPEETRQMLRGDPQTRAAASLANLVVALDLGRGLDAVVEGDVASPAEAQGLAAKMQEQLRDAKKNAQVLMLGLGPYLDGVTARAVDKRFEIHASLGEPQVDDLLSRLAAFLALARQGHAPGFP